MSDEFGQVLSIMSFLTRLGEENVKVQTGAFNKGIKTYNFSANLKITAGLEGKPKRIMVSRHSDFILGPKVSK